MRTVRLGSSELQVSAIALGTWAYGGDWGAVDEDGAKATVRRALEAGINLFDTAQAYGFGAAERLLGEALFGVVAREQVVLATKGGLRLEGDGLVRDAGARWLRSGLESSLRNLGTDYIDLYQVHWPDPRTPAEETAAVLSDLVAEGKIRHVGVSNYSPRQMEQFGAAGPLETVQAPYHMFHRDIEDDVLPYASSHDVGVLVYGPLAHGLLGGHLGRATAFAQGDWRAHSPDFAGERFEQNLGVVERLGAFARSRDVALPELAVAWALAHPAVDVAIVGARRPAQLEGLTGAAGRALSADEREEIDKILTEAVHVRGPSPEGM